jgi:hypothetical protein
MTDTPILPNWVLLEAAKRCGWTYDDIPELQSYYDNDQPYSALCDMILKHEQPPIDRKLLCAREAAKENDPEYWYGVAELERISVRAIELYESGFGK